MPSKKCYDCGWIGPSSEYETHRNLHKNKIIRSHQSNEYRAARKRVRKRDKDTCVTCKRTKAQLQRLGLQLHTHHINLNSYDNRDENLEQKCEECHPRGGFRPRA